MNIGKYLLFLAIAALFCVPAWGGTINCPASFTALSSAQYAGVGDGCTVQGNAFTNFTAGVMTTPVTINGVPVPATGTTPTEATAPALSDISIEIAGNYSFGGGISGSNAGLAYETASNPTTCKSNASPATPSWCLQGKDQVLASYLSYTVTNLAGITQESLAATIISHANTTTAVMFREICAGVANLTWSASANGMAACTGAGGTYYVLEVGEIQGNFTTSTQGQSINFASTTVLSIRDVAFLQTFNGEGSFAGLTAAVDTPEPTTISLVGLSLVGLGCLKFRRPRQAAPAAERS